MRLVEWLLAILLFLAPSAIVVATHVWQQRAVRRAERWRHARVAADVAGKHLTSSD
jgi:hypothetical protein